MANNPSECKSWPGITASGLQDFIENHVVTNSKFGTHWRGYHPSTREICDEVFRSFGKDTDTLGGYALQTPSDVQDLVFVSHGATSGVNLQIL